VPEALSDGGSGREGQAYVLLVCFFKYWSIISSRRRKNVIYVREDFFL
jgi:hypothetical protein